MAHPLESAFHDTVEEGAYRVSRTWPALLATGTVGGIDVSLGVLATLLVLDRSENEVVAALAFSIGFIALTLANSELFTENFLVPIAAVAAEKARLREVARLWAGTAVTNLAGGVLMMGVVVLSFPEIGDTAIEKGSHYVGSGFTIDAFMSAVLAGIVITLMTWMQHSTESMGARVVAAIAASFLLSYGHLHHVIVASLEVMAGIMSGADYGFWNWFRMVWLWAFGNAVGGIALVTVLRLVQVGRRQVEKEQDRPAEGSGHQEGDIDNEASDGEGGSEEERGVRAPA